MCNTAEVQCKQAAAAFPGQVEVTHEDMMTAEFGMYKDMVPPIILIGSELISTGKVVPAGKLKDMVQIRLRQ